MDLQFLWVCCSIYLPKSQEVEFHQASVAENLGQGVIPANVNFKENSLN